MLKRKLIQMKEILETLLDEASTPAGTMTVWYDLSTVIVNTAEILNTIASDYFDWSYIYLEYNTAVNTPVAWFRTLWTHYVDNNQENWRRMYYSLYASDYIDGEYHKHLSENKDITDELTNGKKTTTEYTNLSTEREYGSSGSEYKQTNQVTTDTETTPRDQSATKIDGKYKDTQNGKIEATNSGKDTRTIKGTAANNYKEEYGFNGDMVKVLESLNIRKREDLARYIIQEFARQNLILLPEMRCDHELFSDLVY